MDTGILRQAQALFGVELHPSQCSEALTGVQEILNARLLRYSEDLSGVLLAYNNERILSMQAPVHIYFPYMHVDVAADIVVFCPAPGMPFRGKVIQVGPDYLGLHVLGVFNASIAREHIRPDFSFKPMQKACVSKANSSHIISEGTDVQFTIRTVQREAEFFTLTGALTQKDTGAVEWLPKHKRQQRQPTRPAAAQPAQQRLEQSQQNHQQGSAAGRSSVEPATTPIKQGPDPSLGRQQLPPQQISAAEVQEQHHSKKKKAKRKHAVAADEASGEDQAAAGKKRLESQQDQQLSSSWVIADWSASQTDSHLFGIPGLALQQQLPLPMLQRLVAPGECEVMELMHEMMANELHISQQHEDHEQQQHRSMLAAQAQMRNTIVPGILPLPAIPGMLPELDEAADRSPIFQLRPAWTPALMELPILGQLRGSAAKAHVMKDDHRLVTPEGLHQQLDLQSLPVRPVQPLGNSAAFVDQHIMPKMLDILISKDFLAQDLLLEDNCAMLPPVLLDPLPAFGSNAGACVISVHQMVSELKAKPFRSLAHLEMYLDWTLSDPTQAGTMQQRVLTAKSWIVDQLSPSSKLVTPMQLPRELLGLLEIIHGPALHQPAFMALRPAIPRHLQPTGHAQLATIKKAPRLESKQPARGASATAGPADNAAKLESGGSQQLLSDDSAMLAKQRHPPLSRAHKRHPISTGLQQEGQGKGGLVSRPISADQQPTDSTVLRQAARGQEGVRLPARPCDSDADAASDSSSDSGEDESMMGGVGPHKRPSHVQVYWSAEHSALLQSLRAAHARIIQRTAGLPPGAVSSVFCNPEPASKALAATLELHQHNASFKPVIRSLASMAILQQVALTLKEYGVRCAHLLMRHQCSAASTGAIEPCRAPADALRAGYEQVEAGLFEDHPKQHALCNLLIGLRTLTPGCNVLILCGSGEAFSLFGAIKSANLRAVHLPSAVSSAADSQVTAQPDAVQLTKRRLAAAGECALLASPDQLTLLGPIIEPAAAPNADLPAEEPPACSLAIALQPFSLLRARRPLYEAVLRLEASNISVVERALRGPDIALTPDTCLCIWDGHASQGTEAGLPPALMQSIGNRIWEASFGFSKGILVFEGGNAFQWRLASCLPAIIRATKRARMACQILVSTTAEMTQSMVTSIIRSVLKLGPGQKPLHGPVLQDHQSPAEAFLTSFAALNPLSIACLGSLGLTCTQLLAMNPAEQQALASRLPTISPRALQLFFAQACIQPLPGESQQQEVDPYYPATHRPPPGMSLPRDEAADLRAPHLSGDRQAWPQGMPLPHHMFPDEAHPVQSSYPAHYPRSMANPGQGYRDHPDTDHTDRRVANMRRPSPDDVVVYGHQHAASPWQRHPQQSYIEQQQASHDDVQGLGRRGFTPRTPPAMQLAGLESPGGSLKMEDGPGCLEMDHEYGPVRRLLPNLDQAAAPAASTISARSRNRNGRHVDEFGIEEDPDLEHMRFSQLGDGPPSYPAASRSAGTGLPHDRAPVDPEAVVEQVLRRQTKRAFLPPKTREHASLTSSHQGHDLIDVPLKSRYLSRARHDITDTDYPAAEPPPSDTQRFPDVQKFACTPLKQRRSGQRKMLNKLRVGGRTASHRA
ncbi:hypothetical protein WJX84_008253 [Apatococcus fuscideae]|uniref:RPA43 OB domain-containing protein n=1 Tax=Apatococcus fuscideae TaxID=2026836 RepID=A0AAW1TKQ9_9CHLO